MKTMLFSSWTNDRLARMVLSTVIVGAAINGMSATPKRTASMERHIRIMRELSDTKKGSDISQRRVMGAGTPDPELVPEAFVIAAQKTEHLEAFGPSIMS